MTDRSSNDNSPHLHVDAVSGTETTGHEWDGIRELNTPLPRWWRYIFWATVIWSVVYWVLMPAWPALPGFGGHTPGVRGHSDRAGVAAEMTRLREERAGASQALAAGEPDAVLKDPQLLQFALAYGESLFGDNCATCHGAGGGGARGYPTLADDVWLWGGTVQDIEYTIRHGIRSGTPGERSTEMPAYGRDAFFEPAVIDDLSHYVLSLSGGASDPAAAARAAPVFQKECSTCHGIDGRGDRSQGAPNLTDADWIYGGAREDVRASIWGPIGGVMPAWGDRLDPAAVRAVSVYVHSLGGGE